MYSCTRARLSSISIPHTGSTGILRFVWYLYLKLTLPSLIFCWHVTRKKYAMVIWKWFHFYVVLKQWFGYVIYCIMWICSKPTLLCTVFSVLSYLWSWMIPPFWYWNYNHFWILIGYFFMSINWWRYEIISKWILSHIS